MANCALDTQGSPVGPHGPPSSAIRPWSMKSRPSRHQTSRRRAHDARHLQGALSRNSPMIPTADKDVRCFCIKLGKTRERLTGLSKKELRRFHIYDVFEILSYKCICVHMYRCMYIYMHMYICIFSITHCDSCHNFVRSDRTAASGVKPSESSSSKSRSSGETSSSAETSI